jgi:hypothetical protein
MSARNGPHGPADSTQRFPNLTGQSGTGPVTYCLFQAENLAPPGPPTGMRADGLEMFINDAGVPAVDAMGPLPRMTREAATLPGD